MEERKKDLASTATTAATGAGGSHRLIKASHIVGKAYRIDREYTQQLLDWSSIFFFNSRGHYPGLH
jgi:hypothetical protein